MKDFENIFATHLDIQEKHFGKKKSLVNCNSFQIMAAKHCSGRYVADVTLLQGPTNIFYKTCPWASGMQKSLAQKDEVVVPCHRWYKCCRNYFAPFSGNK